MKICVVEDEEVWRNKIQEIIEKYCIDKNILFQIHLCSNGKDFMKNKDADLVFLDIELAEGENGFEIYCAAEKAEEIRSAVSCAVEAVGGREIYTLEVYVRSIPMEKGFALKQDFKHLNPFECGLGWSVDLDKTFIGKEATLAIRDNPRYQMVGLVFDRESTEDINIWERVYLYGVEVGRCAQAIYGYTVDKNIGFATIRADIPEGTRVTVGPNNSPATVVSKVFC